MTVDPRTSPFPACALIVASLTLPALSAPQPSMQTALGVLSAVAHEPPAQRFPVLFAGSPIGLLQMDRVRKELKMNQEQISKVRTIVKDIGEKHREEFEAVQKLDPSERPARDLELTNTVREESSKALAGVLTAEQHKRLKELYRQVMGINAFLQDSEVQEGLKPTKEQNEKMKELFSHLAERSAEISRNRRGNVPAMVKELRDLNKETLDKAVDVLTDDQKKTWSEMIGAPFDFRAK
jgi:hypothetical protein